MVGAPNVLFTAGAAYVIYGQATEDLGDVDLAELGARGFRFAGAAGSLIGKGDFAGSSVAPAGDVNDDGFDDLLVGAPGVDGPEARVEEGAAYVVYGQSAADPTDFTANAIGARGMKLVGVAAEDRVGTSVAGGDVNGDGVGDAIVGATGADNGGRTSSGSVFVVSGQRIADPADVELGNPGGRGFRIDGQGAGDEAGGSVASGDVNGDGIDDAILGARLADNNGRADSGSTYVVYGRRPKNPANVDLQSLGASGFRVDGALAGDEAGLSVGSAADLDGDGIDDVLIGAPDAAAAGRPDSGEAFVLDGRRAADPADVDLASPGVDTLELDGPTGELFGAPVMAAGDLGGDGHPDLVVGATGIEAAYLIDATGPETTIDSPPPAPTDRTPIFSFHASEANTTFECSIDRGSPSFRPCRGPGARDRPAAPLTDGTYTFRIAAVDASLNADPSPATMTFAVDTSAPARGSVPPQTTITRHPRRTLKLKRGRRRARVAFGFAASTPGSTFSCRLDRARPVSCASPKLYSLKAGGHRFAVAATDAAGSRDASPAVFHLRVRFAERPRRRSPAR